MPKIMRRSTGKRHRTLDNIDLYLYLWEGRVPTWIEPKTDATLRELYEESREQIITSQRGDLLSCVPFWRYEPNVPDELRRLPDEAPGGSHYFHPDDSVAQAALDADVAHTRAVRLAWVALHPPHRGA